MGPYIVQIVSSGTDKDNRVQVLNDGINTAFNKYIVTPKMAKRRICNPLGGPADLRPTKREPYVNCEVS